MYASIERHADPSRLCCVLGVYATLESAMRSAMLDRGASLSIVSGERFTHGQCFTSDEVKRMNVIAIK